MKKKRHILLAVSGGSPAIVTEAFYHLVVEREIPVSEVRIVSTSFGKEQVIRHLIETKPVADCSVFDQLCKDYRINRSKIEFDQNSVVVAKDEKEEFLSDVRDDEHQEFFPNALLKEVRNLSESPDTVIHACISGGRKTMSYYLGVAMMLYARAEDNIFHILVDREFEICKPAFYYPTPKTLIAKYSVDKETFETDHKNGQLYVSKIPFIRLANSFPNREDISYRSVINRFQRELNSVSALDSENFDGPVPKDEEVRSILRRCKELKNDNIILLEGETGTGKGKLAREIHAIKLGNSKDFHTVNLGGVTTQLINGKLLGHRKGSFTGATEDRRGIFEVAGSTGTVFLDEIDKLPRDSQSYLLQVLDTLEYTPIGSEEKKSVDCRIIIAAGKSLKQMVDEGTFYKDLYYRIATFHFILPPLRERPLDILPLARHFLKKFNKKHNKNFVEFDDELEWYLLEQPWDGNIRELESTVQRLVAWNYGDELKLDFLGIAPVERASSKLGKFDRLLKRIIQQTLEDCEGNVSEAAKVLELKYTTLQSKIGKYGINIRKFKSK